MRVNSTNIAAGMAGYPSGRWG